MSNWQSLLTFWKRMGSSVIESTPPTAQPGFIFFTNTFHEMYIGFFEFRWKSWWVYYQGVAWSNNSFFWLKNFLKKNSYFYAPKYVFTRFDWEKKLVKTSDEFVISFTKNAVLASLEIISPHFGGCSKRNDAREHLPQLRGHATIIRNEAAYRVLRHLNSHKMVC